MEHRVPELTAVSSDFDGGAVAARGAMYTTANVDAVSSSDVALLVAVLSVMVVVF